MKAGLAVQTVICTCMGADLAVQKVLCTGFLHVHTYPSQPRPTHDLLDYPFRLPLFRAVPGEARSTFKDPAQGLHILGFVVGQRFFT